jgi:hypothetical protein
MSKNEKDDVAISFVQGEDYEQIKVSAGSKINPDPRVGGTSIMFDSRLDAKPQSDKLL